MTSVRRRVASAVRQNPRSEEAVRRVRARRFDRRVAIHRSAVAARAEAAGYRYSAAASAKTARAKLEQRGGPRVGRAPTILAAWQNVNSESVSFTSEFEKCGELSVVDVDGWISAIHNHRELVGKINSALLETARRMHREGGLHLFFSYLPHSLVHPGTVAAIADLGAATVGLGMDDDIAFLSASEYEHYGRVARVFDMWWTVTRAACEELLLLGATPYYLPEGANADRMFSEQRPQRYQLSFVGQRYGARVPLLRALVSAGFQVAAFGPGWPSGFRSLSQMNTIVNESFISFGHGGRMWSEAVLGLKMRDFDVPMAGGLYLTSYSAELEACYEVGQEILCYSTREQLLGLADWALSHPNDADEIRRGGHERARRCHTWGDRLRTIMAAFGLLPGEA